ncbi:hypothetical protein HPB52_020278 [Rhipicephalus sanguineus]|uniref:Uncharacterized protein n=1 Tax=Rhipicephalus sanguineus TaxID=34632 RepID=A0A9D4PFN1_RHISA|nr:hypothetical protein HPB52_020278 [Rhipicephalus sanguineus]
MSNRNDWSDVIAIKGAREVLTCVKYPKDSIRQSLYASWLRVIVSDSWQESFDHIMLECVAATPSPTDPSKPLFAYLFKRQDLMDLPFPEAPTPVLNNQKWTKLFVHKCKDNVEPLPSSPEFIDFLADLIRKSCSSRAALDEAGLIIGFYSLALAVVAAKPVREVQDFFRTRMKTVLAKAVPTSYDGDVFCTSGTFLNELSRRTYSPEGQVRPYLVLLVLGQYAYYLHTEETPPSAKVLNCILRDSGSREVALSSKCVQEYLEKADGPFQLTRPWCRATSISYFLHLNLFDHVDYAMRLTAFLAPDPNDLLWQRREFVDVSASRIKEARLWARNFKQALRKGDYGTTARVDQEQVGAAKETCH